MDGSSLVRDLAGADHLESAKELHARFYDELVDLLQPLPGARALLDAVAGLHLQVVLASSAPDDELSTLRKVLGRDDIVSVVTDSSDVESAKPDPDIVEVALERAGVGAERAVFVGDSVWDVRAAARAGVACIGLLSGGTSRHELEAEGAVTVWKNPQDCSSGSVTPRSRRSASSSIARDPLDHRAGGLLQDRLALRLGTATGSALYRRSDGLLLLVGSQHPRIDV